MMIYLLKVVKFIRMNTLSFLKIATSDKMGPIEKFTHDIIISHNLGGGTEKYLESKYKGSDFLIIKKISYVFDFAFKVEYEGKKIFINKRKLKSFLALKSFNEIVINSLASFRSYSWFLKTIVKTQKKKMIYMVHDYNSICPTNTLVFNNKYCRLNCASCEYYHKKKIRRYREEWRKFFNEVDIVRCFSNSSKNILIQVYPEIEKKIIVEPHDVSYCVHTPVTATSRLIKIGIIGNCESVAKGIGVIKSFLNEIESHTNIHVIIAGTQEKILKKKIDNIIIIDSYDNGELQKLVEENEINCFLFPSICPETFSYLISELILFDLPIISLNIGAQGEKLSAFKHAVFLESLESKNILTAIEKIK